MSGLLLAGCRLPDGSLVDISSSKGLISGLDPAQGPPSGWLALPRLVEPHVHLDKTFYGGSLPPHQPGESLLDRIESELSLLEQPSIEPVGVRGGRLFEALVANGTGAVRSHVDVSGRTGLSRLEPLLELRARSPIPLQLVAFPQQGIRASPGTADLLAEALQAGCEVLGGLDPATVDGDREGQLELLVGLAAAHGARLDIHLHERNEVGEATVCSLARRVASAGLHGRVAISHGFFLADLWAGAPARFDAAAEVLASTGIALVTSIPGEGLCPPVRALLERGVEVAVGSDNIQDSWSPFGRADPLERAAQVAHAEGWRSDADLARALQLVSAAPARVLGLEPAGLRPGDRADLTLVRSASLRQALGSQPPGRLVVRDGELVTAGLAGGRGAVLHAVTPSCQG